VRPRIPRRDFTFLVSELNSAEQNPNARWEIDSTELSSAIKCYDRNRMLTDSRLSPDVVAGYVRAATREVSVAAGP
jgi:hypothetical protein